jgi:ATP-binding protein involved in chromosome partitioning
VSFTHTIAFLSKFIDLRIICNNFLKEKTFSSKIDLRGEKGEGFLIRNMIAVAAGKGGVGKSSLAAHLAFALKRMGHLVGLLDADVYGPSLEQMLPAGTAPSCSAENPDRIVPGVAGGILLLTAAHFYKEGTAAFVRAPVANSFIEQFLHQAEWGDLDFLIVDFPPGTGDIPLTLLQKGSFAGALLITTPQEVALLDVRKAAHCFQRMEVPLLGIVENMSYFEKEGERQYLFGKGGGAKIAEEFSLPLLGQIPIDSRLAEAGDLGRSLFDLAPDSPSAVVFMEIAKQVHQSVEQQPKEEWEAELLPTGHIKMGQGIISSVELQRICPCIRCGGKGKSSTETKALRIEKVGRFALKVQFSSGCSQGLYPYRLLRRLV